jgi:hypothetical protein
MNLTPEGYKARMPSILRVFLLKDSDIKEKTKIPLPMNLSIFAEFQYQELCL